MKYKHLVVLIILVILATVGYWFWKAHRPKATSPVVSQTQSNIQPPPQTILPDTYKAKVDFTVQAPFHVWDELHNQACEEAVTIMAVNFYEHFIPVGPDGRMDPQKVDDEISKLTDWQQDVYKNNLSITTEQTASMMRKVYGLHAKVVKYDVYEMKKAIALENGLVVLPLNGRDLNNPYFKQPGPVYHMVLVKGYDKDNIITNDPGIGKGFDYTYPYDIIDKALGSWDLQTESLDQNIKEMILIYPE